MLWCQCTLGRLDQKVARWPPPHDWNRRAAPPCWAFAKLRCHRWQCLGCTVYWTSSTITCMFARCNFPEREINSTYFLLHFPNRLSSKQTAPSAPMSVTNVRGCYLRTNGFMAAIKLLQDAVNCIQTLISCGDTVCSAVHSVSDTTTHHMCVCLFLPTIHHNLCQRTGLTPAVFCLTSWPAGIWPVEVSLGAQGPQPGVCMYSRQ